MTVKLPPADCVEAQPLAKVASTVQSYEPGCSGCASRWSCEVVPASCGAPWLRAIESLYCDACGTALHRKSTGETTWSSASAGATRMARCAGQSGGNASVKAACAESSGGQPLKLLRTNHSSLPGGTSRVSDVETVVPRDDGAALFSASQSS